ncbi:Uncharacterised protein [Nocardia otitidiscaviarum]|uniref:Arsenate reductase n=1 Tax=Nocardia otitidiscaviarum TaxID=1823 RepID=A0A379JIY2_9NOCA|nr:hypothetical protein [Nocardia otitidiscaviarum]SUD48400.1 Uncharacterised protein [Nocardia otitidiscaviarum]
MADESPMHRIGDMDSGPVVSASDRAWVAVDACTLPSEGQLSRVAEFDALFRDGVRGVERVSPTRLRLDLDSAAVSRARELAAVESDCCSFFAFEFTTVGEESVCMDIEVPPARVDVLDGLAARAIAGGSE